MPAEKILIIKINALYMVSIQKCIWNEYKRKIVHFEDATLLPLCGGQEKQLCNCSR